MSNNNIIVNNVSYHWSNEDHTFTDIVKETPLVYRATVGRQISYRLRLHQHPYVQELIQRLVREGSPGLQAADTDGRWEPQGDPRRKFKPTLLNDRFFAETYRPYPDTVPNTLSSPHPIKDLDFSSSGAYSSYNWELFYHVPITIAIHLSKNQRYAEAQRWFHYIFDPTDNSDGPTPERFWKVRPFQETDVRKIEEILVNLVTDADHDLRAETLNSINAWKDAPFRPHVVAGYRQQAYMYKAVMAYLDNLVAWGDSLYRQDTGEAIDEALMLYVLAANILGPRPLPVPKKGTVRPQTYANLKKDLAEFGTVLRDLEAAVPYDNGPLPSAASSREDRLVTLRSLGQSLYFCIPRNDKLLGYWDTVADRLFKIHNSQNFQGVFRQLALFEPPIDPAMLARAAAAGLDVGAIVNGINQPLPLVRFQLLVQKAMEIVQEVKSLGSNLLAAMEKEDGEAMTILRARHERQVMEFVEHSRYTQLQEAKKALAGTFRALRLAIQRYTFYERQLGRPEGEIRIPQLDDLDRDALARMRFDMDEPDLTPRTIDVNIAQDLGNSRGTISSFEKEELAKLDLARGFQIAAGGLDAVGGVLALVPSMTAKAQPMGVGAAVEFGGQHLHSVQSSLSSVARIAADQFSSDASMAVRMGSYSRRAMDWAFQSNLAAGEISQIFTQLRAAQLREAVAKYELDSHQRQMEHAKEIQRFLNEEGTERTGKKTNKALYTWMKREAKGLYAQCFQLAFDVARKAERALQHELGNSDLTYLQFGYLAGKEGLLAGERLYLDVKRMEMAYHELNQREYELTKHVSLLQINPLALVQLRNTGICTVQLKEAIFDVDGPGHYFRRIKNVALSIPCVAGPYASLNCTLTLLKSGIRKSPGGDGYARNGADDPRFSDFFGSTQSIVTSSGQNDSGLFETNLRDERYLPFEYSGVISEWQLQLPADPTDKQGMPQFDYNTISDVILHVRYTAREGGASFRESAIANLKGLIKSGADHVGLVRMFSIRHEFPNEWARLNDLPPDGGRRRRLSLALREEHYPYWCQGQLTGAGSRVSKVEIFVRSDTNPGTVYRHDIDPVPPVPPSPETFVRTWGLFKAGLRDLPAKPIGQFEMFFEPQPKFQDIWLAVSWQGGV